VTDEDDVDAHTAMLDEAAAELMGGG